LNVALRTLSLCSGIGALDLGFDLGLRALGASSAPVLYVEREAYCAEVLAARMEDGVLEAAPVWDDLSTLDGHAIGHIDAILSGLPCQPYSLAGSQKGHADERALYPELVRLVAETEPALVFLENVPAFRKHFEPLWSELRGLGFEWAPPLLQTASELGAPHIRARFFALATHPQRFNLRVEQGRSSGESGPGAPQSGRDYDADAHPDRTRLEGRSLRERQRTDERPAGKVRGSAADTSSERKREPNYDERPESRKRSREDAGGGDCRPGAWAFDPERQTLRYSGTGGRTVGTPWALESPPVRVDDGPPLRVGQLRAIGNSVVPAVAASALVTLVEAIT
jgi:DNA (cytosine-5)-methyltransferase 1